jgi:hypothetical protein
MVSGKYKMGKYLSRKERKKIIVSFKPVWFVSNLLNTIQNAKNVIKLIIIFVLL